MVGFKLSATSNTIYSRDYEQWTEGDFWISDAITVMSKIPGLGAAGKVIGQGAKSKKVINAAFDGLLNGCLSDLSNIGNQMGVTVHGTDDTFLAYSLFNYDESGFEMVKRFVLNLKRTSDVYGQDLGDQVMIQICRTIKEFDLKMPFGMFGQLWIELQF